jgi:hypothetical protein
MTNFLQTVEADAAKAVALVKSGLTFLDHEAQTLIAWVEKDVPGSTGAIASFLQAAEADAADLAKYAANGLGSQISNGLDDMQTLILNAIQSSGLATNAKGAVKALDVSAVALFHAIGPKLFSVGLAQVLAKLAPALAAGSPGGAIAAAAVSAVETVVEGAAAAISTPAPQEAAAGAQDKAA